MHLPVHGSEINKTKAGSTFWAYCLKHNRLLVLVAIILNALLFGYCKHVYPYPDFFADSYTYVTAAHQGLNVYYRPAGYAWFLRGLHFLSSSPLLVVWVQYVLLVIASLLLFFSIDYLLGFHSRFLRMLCFTGLAFNPLFLMLANQIGSDALFSALTLSWFALLLWLFMRPGRLVLALHLLLLAAAFIVRYNALYYPLISCLTFLLACNAKGRFRLTGILVTMLMIGGMYFLIKKGTEQATGADVFSGFSGWQIANNALYIHDKVKVEPTDFEDSELRAIDRYVNIYQDSLADYDWAKVHAGIIGVTFMWNAHSPLLEYADHYRRANHISERDAWYRVSISFAKYGQQLILQHPAAYLKVYVWGNILRYLYPQREMLEEYNANRDNWFTETVDYFKLHDAAPDPYHNPKLKARITRWYPSLHVVAVMLCVFAPLLYLLRMRKKRLAATQHNEFLLVIMWLCFWGANFVFTVLTSVVVLRCEAAWFALAAGLPVWFLDGFFEKRIEPNT